MENIAEGFWAPRDPAYTEPTSAQRLLVGGDLATLVLRHAVRISTRTGLQDLPPDSRTFESLQLVPDVQLAKLRMLREVVEVAEELASVIAASAGSAGVTYPQLGAAWGITRQAARNRWPGVVKAASTAPVPDPVKLGLAGGDATISYLADEGGWWWIATAANGRNEEAEETYGTSEEAAAYAGAFLLANNKTEMETGR